MMPNANRPRQQPVTARGPAGMSFGVAAKPKNFKESIKKLLKYLSPYRLQLVIVVIFAILSTLFSIISPKVLGNITNQVVTGYIDMKVYDQITSHLPKGTVLPPGTTVGVLFKNLPASVSKNIPESELKSISSLDLSSRPGIDFVNIGRTIIILIGLYIISAIFGYIQSWMMTGITQKVTYTFRKEISDKINSLPLKYFDNTPFGDVLSRVTNDVDTISQSLNQSLIQALTSVITIIGILILMFTISWQLTVVSLLVLPLSFSLVSIIIKKSQVYFKAQQDYLGDLDGHIEEMYSGHRLVKVFNAEGRSVQKFVGINNKLYDSAWKSQFFSGLMFPIMTFIGNLGYVAVSITGGILALHGIINIGDIQAFIQYVSQFNQPIAQVANIANILQSAAASAERVFEFLEEKDQSPDPIHPVILSSVKGDVQFDHVTFGYTPDKMIIKDFTTHIYPGQKVAIVGPTGAGKTTLVNLLMRFYDINEGNICVDNVDIALMNRADVRGLFGMVLQDTWLFNGTIKENIAYGKADATDAQIEAAAKAAHVDHFIHALPKGYDMVLSEDAEDISQGEKQLLTIARAMLVNPPMLILDEATSSVDTRTELLIQEAMETLTKGRTSFVIAHRLSTIKNADIILVMQDGNIIEQGTHQELLEKNGFYTSLYDSQFSE